MSYITLCLGLKPVPGAVGFLMHLSLQFTPKAVNSCGAVGQGSSHFQAQCHHSHSRAVFDMSATIAGVFEETEWREVGVKKGK
jgi:hypothetical protein